MTLTVIEVLENAQYNLKSAFVFQRKLGLEQLENAVDQLNEEDSDANADYINKE